MLDSCFPMTSSIHTIKMNDAEKMSFKQESKFIIFCMSLENLLENVPLVVLGTFSV